MEKFDWEPGWWECPLMKNTSEGWDDRNDLPWMNKALGGRLSSVGIEEMTLALFFQVNKDGAVARNSCCTVPKDYSTVW